jgi:cbb3-type cytochrome oxidase subunit 3
MKKYHNMTDESDFEGNEAFFEENRPLSLSIADLVLTLFFLVCFFGSIYLYFENKTLKEELEQKHMLIMDLGKLLERQNE